MTAAETLDAQFLHLDANESFSEALVALRDGTRLGFVHRVGERKAVAVGPQGREGETGAAGQLLERLAHFRLNAKHLELVFGDGSRWERKPAAQG